MSHQIALLLLAVVASGFSAEMSTPEQGPEPESMAQPETGYKYMAEPESIFDVASGMNMSTFSHLAYVTGVMEILMNPGNYTVFVPSDQAFTDMASSVWSQPENMEKLLKKHIVPMELMSEDMENRMVPTMSGEDISLDVEDGIVIVNDVANVTQSDVMASNGVIHVIDSVLLPEDDYDQDLEIIKVLEEMGLPEEVMEELSLDELRMLFNSTSTKNDFIEAVTRNLFGPSDTNETLTILETANIMNMSTFVGLAYQAGGVSMMLMEPGPYTVFVPNDEAFGDLDFSKAWNEPEYLEKLMKLHIVPMELMSEDMEMVTNAPTMSGEDISLDVGDGTVIVNDVAMVIKADIMVSNGVIHVIDNVLLPKDDDMGDSSSGSGDHDVETGLGIWADETIMDIADSMGMDSFLGLAYKAGIMPLLMNEAGSYTVFIPSEEAFANVDPNVIMKTMSDNEYLERLMKTHIVPMKMMSGDIMAEMVPTMSGDDISLMIEDGIVVVNHVANVTQSDVMASNGVIHIIDTVLVPEDIETIFEDDMDKTSSEELDEEIDNMMDVSTSLLDDMMKALDELTKSLNGMIGQ